MQLFIANGTSQVQAFPYRIPEVPQARIQHIAIGGQIRISGELNALQIEAIIKQYRKYGIIEASEIDKGHGGAPLAFQLDKPFSSQQIESMNRRNTSMLSDLGRKIREDAAIVLTNQIGNDMRREGIESELDHIEVTLEQEPDKGSKPAGGDRLQETTIVSREDRPDPRANQRRK